MAKTSKPPDFWFYSIVRFDNNSAVERFWPLFSHFIRARESWVVSLTGDCVVELKQLGVVLRNRIHLSHWHQSVSFPRKRKRLRWEEIFLWWRIWVWKWSLDQSVGSSERSAFIGGEENSGWSLEAVKGTRSPVQGDNIRLTFQFDSVWIDLYENSRFCYSISHFPMLYDKFNELHQKKVVTLTILDLTNTYMNKWIPFFHYCSSEPIWSVMVYGITY